MSESSPAYNLTVIDHNSSRLINISTQVPISAPLLHILHPRIKSMLFHDWVQNLFRFLFIYFFF